MNRTTARRLMVAGPGMCVALLGLSLADTAQGASVSL